MKERGYEGEEGGRSKIGRVGMGVGRGREGGGREDRGKDGRSKRGRVEMGREGMRGRV